MIPRKSVVLLTSIVMALAFVLLLGSARAPAQTGFDCEAPWGERVNQARNEFGHRLDNGVWALKYEFFDYRGVKRKIECDVSDQQHQSLKDGFGLFLCENQGNAPHSLDGAAACKCEVDRDVVPLTRSQQVYDDYLAQRSVRFVSKALLPDYSLLARKSAAPLTACSMKLKEELRIKGRLGGNKEAERDLLAFFKGVRKGDDPKSLEQEPEVEMHGGRGKWIGGLLVPTDVLINDHGDCDSKALAFLTLLGTQEEQGVLFRSASLDCDPTGRKGHAFAAVLRGQRPDPMKVNLEQILLKGARIDSMSFGADPLNPPPLKIGVLLEFDILDLSGPGRTDPGVLDRWKYGRYIGLVVDSHRARRGSPGA